VAGLAGRFGVTREDVASCVASLRAVREALFDDLDLDLESGDLPLPDLPEDFEILDEIGRGGMGVVYRVHQRSLDRTLAVKVVRPGALGFAEAVRRFRKEAKALARLRHPGIVSVHEVGTAGDAVWFSMDLVEGESLADHLREGALPDAEAARLVRQAASAVAHAHGRGVIHRDLKPANVLLDAEGNAWVVDFGLARATETTLDATGTGRLLGTPAYMAPEQVRGAEADERTDVYALGALLYECLAGRPPYEGSTVGGVLHEVSRHEPTPLRRLVPSVPRDLETIVMTAMARRPSARYATVRAMIADLDAYADGAPIRARRPGLAAGIARFVVRHRSSLATALVTALLLAAAGWTWIVPRLGRSPETMLETGEMLLAEDEATAARAVLEDALEVHGADRKDVLGLRLHRALARARAATIRRWFREGRYDEAATLAAKTVRQADFALGERGWPDAPRVLLDRLRLAMFRGDEAAVDNGRNLLRSRMLARAGDREPMGDRRAVEAVRATVELLAETLDDPDPTVRATARILFDLPWRPEATRVISRWLADRRERLPEVVRELVRLEAANGMRSAFLTHLLPEIGETASRDVMTAALEELSTDDGETPAVRGAALDLLSIVADLPRARGPGRERSDPARDARILAAWREQRGSTRAEALRAGFDAAVDLGDTAWLRAHAEAAHRDADSWRRWWREVRDLPARVWIDGGDPEEPLDVQELLRSLGKMRRRERTRWHVLLTLAVPDSVRPPAPGVHADLVAAWQEALAERPAASGPWTLRVVAIRFLGIAPPAILWEKTEPIRVGETLVVEGVHEEPAEGGFAYRIPGLGALFEPAPMERTTASATLRLAWGEEGLELTSREGSWSRRAPGSTSTHGSAGERSVVAGRVLATDSMEGYSGGARRAAINDVLLAIVTEPGVEAGPWTLEDWRDRVAGDLEEIGSHDDWWNTIRIVGKLGLPGRAEAVSRVLLRTPLWSEPRAVAPPGRPSGESAPRRPPRPERRLNPERIRARLAAGDATVVVDPALAEGLESRWPGGHEEDPRWWGRLLITTEEPAIRKLAAGVLADGDLPAPVAAELDRAIRAEGLEVPAALRAEVDGADRRFLLDRLGRWAPALVLVGLVGLLALVSTLRVLWPGRPEHRRLRPAAWMVFAGGVLVSLDIRWGAIDLLHDGAGLALLIVGTFLLGRAAPGPAARRIGVGLTISLVAAVAVAFGAGETTRMFTGLGVALVFASLPWLAFVLDTDGRPRARFPVFTVLYVIPVALLWVTALWALIADSDLKVNIEGVLGLVILAGTSGAALWALLVLRWAAGRRAASL
jgi:predicted Ser/Thr protein kinase